MVVRLGDLGDLGWASEMQLLINGETVATGTMEDLVKVAEERSRPGDRLTFLEVFWD